MDLGDFSNIVRLFPLPGVVLFPNAVLRLHIFEPRYRQMTADALASDKLVTIVQYRTGVETAPGGRPPIEAVACLGKIIQHERLPDGRYNFLLLGLKRVRLIDEVPLDKLYRIAEAEILEDEPEDDGAESLSTELAEAFRTLLVRQKRLDTDFDQLLQNPVPLSVLTDIVSHALPIPPKAKQILLEEVNPVRRARTLLDSLADLTGTGSPEDRSPRPPGQHWPPPFSLN